MDRRTFVLLSGAAAAASWRPGSTPLVRAPAAGRLRFDLDEQRRWSLWYRGDGTPVPLIKNATLGAWVADAFVTLGELEDTSVANRRPPGGESLAIRGRCAAGVWIEAEFTAWEAGPGAQGSISISVYPDRVLATIPGVRFFSLPESQILPPASASAGPLLALVNGYRSSDECSTVAAATAQAVSHAALGLGRDTRGLAVAFEPGEPGEAKVKLAGGTLDAISDWLPPRPVRPEGDTSTMRLAFVPAPQGDALTALAALATPASAVDRERLAALASPTGWCSRYELGDDVTEADVIANLDFCAAHFDRRFFRYIQLDDGYQRAAGDWDTNAKFPNGHRWLTDRIHGVGFLAGLWIAPFVASEPSGIPAAHPAWLVKGPDGAPLVVDTREAWGRGGRVYVLDGAHPEVQDWLHDLTRRVVRDWGYDYLKVDLSWAAAAADFVQWTFGSEATSGGGS